MKLHKNTIFITGIHICFKEHNSIQKCQSLLQTKILKIIHYLGLILEVREPCPVKHRHFIYAYTKVQANHMILMSVLQSIAVMILSQIQPFQN